MHLTSKMHLPCTVNISIKLDGFGSGTDRGRSACSVRMETICLTGSGARYQRWNGRGLAQPGPIDRDRTARANDKKGRAICINESQIR